MDCRLFTIFSISLTLLPRGLLFIVVVMKYDVGRKPKKSQAFARVICHIAVKERGLSIEAVSETEIQRIVDDALLRYPKICDARFRKMAIGV